MKGNNAFSLFSFFSNTNIVFVSKPTCPLHYCFLHDYTLTILLPQNPTTDSSPIRKGLKQNPFRKLRTRIHPRNLYRPFECFCSSAQTSLLHSRSVSMLKNQIDVWLSQISLKRLITRTVEQPALIFEKCLRLVFHLFTYSKKYFF